MYIITKQFEFSASHILIGLPEGHQCGRLHGHNYIVMVELRSATLDEIGFVRDYGDLKKLKDFIDNHLDHRHLNEVLTLNPTAENLAGFLFAICSKWWKETYAIRISETPKTWAIYINPRFS